MSEKNVAGFDIPVLFLIFNRPDTTLEVFNAIKKVKPARLYVAADGPRSNKPGEHELCEATRAVVQLIDWDCELKTLFRESNLGCKEAVSQAISWFFEKEEMGIILEDDCLPIESFFAFCKEVLIKYNTDERIMLIGGQHFLSRHQTPDTSYYFSQYPHIWGWATWRRAWNHYDISMGELKPFLEAKLKKCFKNENQRKHLTKHLNLTKSGKLNTWDYQWLYSILNAGGLAITPSKNMVTNLGFSNQSTHVFLKDSYKEGYLDAEIPFPLIHPMTVSVADHLDYLEYRNVYSKDITRLYRLFRENGIINCVSYVLKRLK
jgi:hypothetical protein